MPKSSGIGLSPAYLPKTYITSVLRNYPYSHEQFFNAHHSNCIEELLCRSYSEKDFEKICSGNLLWVWEEVGKFANF